MLFCLAGEVERHRPAAELLDLRGDRFVDLAGQHALDDLQRRIIRVPPALDEPRLDLRLLHRPRNRRPAAVHDDRPHADRFHEHDVDQQVPQRLGVLHHAAAELDDRDLVAELADPAHRLDQQIRFLDGVLDHGLIQDSLESNKDASRIREGSFWRLSCR